MVRKRTKHDANLTGRTTFFGEHPMDKLSQKPKKYPPTKSWKSWHEKGSFRVKVWKFTVASDFFSHIVLLPFFPFTSMIFSPNKIQFFHDWIVPACQKAPGCWYQPWLPVHVCRWLHPTRPQWCGTCGAQKAESQGFTLRNLRTLIFTF